MRKARSLEFGCWIGYLHGYLISQDEGRLCNEVKVFDLVFRYFSESLKVTERLEVDSEDVRKVIHMRVKS